MIGKYVNSYEVDEIIESGGMSTVYLGIHKDIGYKVAIKALNPLLQKKPNYIERFRNEALLLSQLKHPGILSFYDYIENKDGIFIITEYVKGQTLEEYIDQVSGPISETRSIKILLKILDAVEYMHFNNIIHRDIKPSNFMITSDNDIRIIDFGIAKSLDDTNHLLTKDGTKVGTTFYMSPQQVKGQVLDRRTDIYSLGVTLFQMVTGQYPYEKSTSEYEIYNKIVNDPLPSAKDFYTGVSQKMLDVISKATQKKPLDRYQSCDELRKDLSDKPETTEVQSTVSLKTRLIEAVDVDLNTRIFSKTFWQHLILLFATVGFLAAVVSGIYFLTKKDVRHVIEDKQLLLAGDSLNAEPIEVLNYGETVKVLNFSARPAKDGIYWIKVYSLRGNAGYVPKSSLEIPQIYRQINSVFGNTLAGTMVPSKYKRALRKFFIQNNMMSQNYTSWKLFAEPKKDFEYSTISEGDFNNNSIPDFACVISNIETNQYKLLIFFDNLTEYYSVDYKNTAVKIKKVEKDKNGGKWFMGETFKHRDEAGIFSEIQKFDYLLSEGLLLYNTDTKQNLLYLFNTYEKMFNVYVQPK